MVLALGVAFGVLTPTAPFLSPAAGDRLDVDPGITTVSSSDSLERIACARVDREALVRTWRGVRPARSGDVLLIPEEPNFVNGGLSHATPFDHTQEVPVFIYGPGYVRPGVYEEPVTLADLAPTTAALLKFPFEAPDGLAQTAALLPDADRPLPALVVTVIWDSVGDNVLERWPDAWPVLRSLRPGGAWFSNATVGAAPSNTPVAHATIGTGAFPRRHGFVDVYLRAHGRVQEPNETGPGLLLEPTLGDLYDAAMANRPKVGTVATLSEHLMMMSHGSDWPGGDRDIAIARVDERGATSGVESQRWNLAERMAPYYDLPPYANDLTPLSRYLDDVDRADGALDGRWRQNDIARLSDGFDTPARAPFEEALVETVIEREGFGADAVPDLLFVNFKATDTIGHAFSADGVEMSDAVASQDAELGRLVGFLDRTVGRGEWVLILAADHGTQNDPEASGAFMIDADKLRAGLERTFDLDDDDVPVVQKLRPSQIWMDLAELSEHGFTLGQVSHWLLGLTQAETFTASAPPRPGHAGDAVFAAVLPSSNLSSLPCLERLAEVAG